MWTLKWRIVYLYRSIGSFFRSINREKRVYLELQDRIMQYLHDHLDESISMKAHEDIENIIYSCRDKIMNKKMDKAIADLDRVGRRK